MRSQDAYLYMMKEPSWGPMVSWRDCAKEGAYLAATWLCHLKGLCCLTQPPEVSIVCLNVHHLWRRPCDLLCPSFCVAEVEEFGCDGAIGAKKGSLTEPGAKCLLYPLRPKWACEIVLGTTKGVAPLAGRLISCWVHSRSEPRSGFEYSLLQEGANWVPTIAPNYAHGVPQWCSY